MKKILFSIAFFLVLSSPKAQEFTSHLNTARTAYSGGKLEDTRFALQQMLLELDIIMGKEILKLLPQKMQDLAANTAQDNVTGTSGFVGVIIHRDYGKDDKNIDLEVITNSPMIASLNTLLSLPFVGNTGDSKVVKINGYKALVQKVSGDNDRTDFELQLPLNSTLITLKAPGYTQEQVVAMANTLPVAAIAKMVQ